MALVGHFWAEFLEVFIQRVSRSFLVGRVTFSSNEHTRGIVLAIKSCRLILKTVGVCDLGS